MQYTQGKVARVFVVKFEDGEIFLDALKALAKKEKVRSAAVMFLGAFRDGTMAAGPKKPVVPPTANMVTFKDGWEVLGAGTIFTNALGPQLHIHTAMGKKRTTLTGCVRGNSRVFLVVEAIVWELQGVRATKDIDPATGLNLLRIHSKKERV